MSWMRSRRHLRTLSLLLLSGCFDATAPDRVSLSVCSQYLPTQWLLVKNELSDGSTGSEEWRRIDTVGPEATFDATSRLSIAFISSQSPSAVTAEVFRLTAEDFDVFRCPAEPTFEFHDYSGSFAGVGTNQAGVVMLGSGFANGNNSAPFSFTNIYTQPADLAAYRMSWQGEVIDRMIIRREVNLPDGATLPVLDFTSSEAFAPQLNTFTVTDAGNDEVSFRQYLRLRNTTVPFPLVWYLPSGRATLYGLPTERAGPGDLSSLETWATNTLGSRYLWLTYATPRDFNLSLGPALATPITTLVTAGPPARFRTEIPRQSEYANFASVLFAQSVPGHSHSISITTTRAFSPEGSTWQLEIPDFGAVADFDAALPFSASEPYMWIATAGSGPVLWNFVPVEKRIDGQLWRAAFRGGT